MKTLIFSLMLSLPAFSQNTCEVRPVDFLVIGDSQTGAFWASGYFGNYLQKCMKENSKFGNFVVYGRGGSEPKHWIDNSGLDKIETIQRDNDHNHLNLGANAPLCKKRMSSILENHDPKRVLIFLGDNLLIDTQEEIIKQFKAMLAVIKSKNISAKDCFLLTPTYELTVKNKRNVPSKNLVNTKKVISAIKTAVAGQCQVLDGVELMKDSPYHLGNDLLKRVPRSDGAGCMGASENDNIHLCGEAAFDFANRVCDQL